MNTIVEPVDTLSGNQCPARKITGSEWITIYRHDRKHDGVPRDCDIGYTRQQDNDRREGPRA